MMQALFQFAGAQALFSGSFTLATGISPSVCNLEIAPGGNSLRVGPLVLAYGSTRLVWRDCIVDSVETRVDENGFTTWQVSILDRRWKWRGLGKISGNYNTRVGGAIVDATRRSARRLAEDCLDALGERNYDTGSLPTDIFPEVEWDYEPPAEALAKLCDDIGYVVVLDVRDRVRVQPKGFGPPLPNLPSVISYSQMVDPPEVPSQIIIVGGYTRYNAWWQLEAVGVEADGTVKSIDELSYKPAGGWGSADIKTWYQVAEESRGLAQQSVFRWYRIKASEIGTLPGDKEPISDLSLILPTDPDQFERVIDPETGAVELKNSEVYGVFYNGTDNFGVWYDEEDPPGEGAATTAYPEDYDIDTERGIVKFPRPMYQLYIGSSRTGGSGVEAATLWLRCGVSKRDPQTRAIERWEYRGSRRTGSIAPPRYVIRDELVRERVLGLEGGAENWTDNVKELIPQAAAIYRKIAEEYETKTPAAAAYDGIVPISPSGATPSVTWTIDESGRASTRATIHVEDLRAPVPSRSESRFAERARAENAKKRNARAEREKARRAGKR